LIAVRHGTEVRDATGRHEQCQDREHVNPGTSRSHAR
jgi:hypothetical protein